MNPQAFSAIANQFRFTQVREMTGYGRLGRADGVCQLADTEFMVLQEKQEAAQAGLMRNGGIKRRRQYIHASEYIPVRIFGQQHI